jgi:Fur family transcriptional regulator, ferric uptake regulator
MDTQTCLKKLKDNGLKITPRRKAVIEVFLEQKKFLGPYEVSGLLRRKKVSAGLPSLYRILDELEKNGILVRIENKDRRIYYGLCLHPGSDHHHFICTKCSRVEEVDLCNFNRVSRFIEQELKGKVQYHSLHIEGLCSKCK